MSGLQQVLSSHLQPRPRHWKSFPTPSLDVCSGYDHWSFSAASGYQDCNHFTSFGKEQGAGLNIWMSCPSGDLVILQHPEVRNFSRISSRTLSPLSSLAPCSRRPIKPAACAAGKISFPMLMHPACEQHSQEHDPTDSPNPELDPTDTPSRGCLLLCPRDLRPLPAWLPADLGSSQDPGVPWSPVGFPCSGQQTRVLSSASNTATP